MKISARSKRLILFLALSAISIGLILHFTVNDQTRKALADLDIIYLIALIGLWLLSLTMDASAIVLLTRGTGERLKLWTAFKITTLRIFFNVVTPFSFGGQPFVIYTLSKEGIPGGKGSSIVITKMLILSAFIQLGAISAFIFFHDYISNIPELNTVFFVTGILFITLILAGFVAFLNPRFLIKLVTNAEKILLRFRLLKSEKSFRKRIIHEACLARRSFKRYFSKQLGCFIAGFLCSGFMYSAEVLMLLIILRGLGVTVGFIEGITLSALLLFLLSFMPTPGSAGLGEGIFVVIFAGTVPKYLLGIAVILWRFFYHYLSAILGAISSAKYFSNIFVKK